MDKKEHKKCRNENHRKITIARVKMFSFIVMMLFIVFLVGPRS